MASATSALHYPLILKMWVNPERKLRIVSNILRILRKIKGNDKRSKKMRIARFEERIPRRVKILRTTNWFRKVLISIYIEMLFQR